MFFKTRKMVQELLRVVKIQGQVLDSVYDEIDDINENLQMQVSNKIDSEALEMITAAANGKIKFEFNNRSCFIFGGAYTNKPLFAPGIKLAQEIDTPYKVKLDISDFSVPKQNEAKIALLEAFLLLAEKNYVYVGCAGGLGRTGLFIALMTKVYFKMVGLNTTDPVIYTREYYNSRALETVEQVEFVKSLDIDSIAARLKSCGLFDCN